MPNINDGRRRELEVGLLGLAVATFVVDCRR